MCTYVCMYTHPLMHRIQVLVPEARVVRLILNCPPAKLSPAEGSVACRRELWKSGPSLEEISGLARRFEELFVPLHPRQLRAGHQIKQVAWHDRFWPQRLRVSHHINCKLRADARTRGTHEGRTDGRESLLRMASPLRMRSFCISRTFSRAARDLRSSAAAKVRKIDCASRIRSNAWVRWLSRIGTCLGSGPIQW
jgi:hypothetical protein